MRNSDGGDQMMREHSVWNREREIEQERGRRGPAEHRGGGEVTPATASLHNSHGPDALNLRTTRDRSRARGEGTQFQRVSRLRPATGSG